MNPDRQTGLALISVLLVMALVLLLVAGMLRSHQLSISSTGQQIRSLQLWHLALAGENLARQGLRRDAEAMRTTVNLAQPWAGARDVQLALGTVRVRIEDLAGRFNLAALAQQGQVDQITLQRWQRLCQSLGLPLLDVQALSNQMLLDPSQLRLIPGAQGQALQQLRPLIAVLPSEAGLNINTASEHVLAVLEGLDAGSARAARARFRECPALHHGPAGGRTWRPQPWIGRDQPMVSRGSRGQCGTAKAVPVQRP